MKLKRINHEFIQFVLIILLTLYMLLLEHCYLGDCHQCHYVKDITLKTRG